MTFIFNYKGKNFTEEEIVQRINAGISTESEKSIRLLIMNLSNTQLNILKPLLPDIQEICDCLFLQKYMAAITLTNLLFETMVKLTLVYNEANGRTLDDGYEFENIYEKELNKYGKKNLGENIETLYEKQCTFALDNKDLYLTDNSQIIKINKETLKQETIKKVENRAIALVNNKIVYATGTQLKMMSLNGKDDQILFKNIVVSDLQVLGSDLFTKGYVQESGVKYIVFNIKGQYKALNENTAQEFENLQDA